MGIQLKLSGFFALGWPLCIIMNLSCYQTQLEEMVTRPNPPCPTELVDNLLNKFEVVRRTRTEASAWAAIMITRCFSTPYPAWAPPPAAGYDKLLGDRRRT